MRWFHGLPERYTGCGSHAGVGGAGWVGGRVRLSAGVKDHLGEVVAAFWFCGEIPRWVVAGL